MVQNVKNIAKQAFDSINSVLTDVVHPGILRQTETGVYDSSSASYAVGPITRNNCSVIVDQIPSDGRVGNYTITQKENVLIVASLDVMPRENDFLIYAGQERIIAFVEDILLAGGLYRLVVR